MKKMVCKLVWDFGEGWYFAFGFDVFAPVKLLFPQFDRIVFEGMLGIKGRRLD